MSPVTHSSRSGCVSDRRLPPAAGRFCDELAAQHGPDNVNERELFHVCPKDVLQKIVSSSTVGFDPRLGGGE